MGFKDILSYLLQSRNISNYRLAKDINVSQSTIKNWIDGKTSPNVPQIINLVRYFDVSADLLLGIICRS